MSFVQAAAADNGSGATTLTVNISASGAGNTIIVGVFGDTTVVALSSVIDSKGQNYGAPLIALPVAGSVNDIAIFAFPGTVSGVTSVTVTWASSISGIMFVAEESGLATSANTRGTPTGATAQNGTSWSSGNTIADGTTVVAYGFAASNISAARSFASSGSWAPVTGSGITAGEHDNTVDGVAAFMERLVISASGNYAATGTCVTASNVTALVAAFGTLTPPALMGQILT